MAEMLSPGVFTTEIDASTIAPTVSNSIGVFAGQFEKGPVGDYLLITTVDELIEYYGLPTNSNYNDWYQAYNFLQYGNKLYISRAVDNATSTNAVAEVAVAGGVETTDTELESDVPMIGNADEYETAETSIAFSGAEAKLKFIAKNPGTWGNDIEIAIANPDAFNDEDPALAFEGVPLNDLFEYYPTGTQVGIVIRCGNDIKEVFTVDMDPATKDQNNKSNYIETVINAQSNYVFVKDNTAIAGVPANYLYQHSSVGVGEEPFAPIQLTAPNDTPHQSFGGAVAVDGTRLVVSAMHESATDAGGIVYIYDWNGTSYDEVDTLTASDAKAWDHFGQSVALDGTRLVVGSTLENTVGKVYVYEWNGTSYDEVTTITASDAQAEDFFGSSVALDGTRLVVGAFGEDTAARDAGKVYVYDWNGTSYVEVTTLTASDAQELDRFGAGVSLDGTRLVVGSPLENTAGSGAGKVYVYDWNGTTSTYDEVGTLTASDAEAGDLFGISVALDGSRLVVGAGYEDTAANDAGKVYIYDWNGTTSTYDEVATVTASDASAEDWFGNAVAVDGTRLVVGAAGANDDMLGKVYIYYFDDTMYDPIETPPDEPIEPDPEFGTLVYEMTVPGLLGNDWFGDSMDTSGDVMVIGAPGDGESGAVYMYNWNGTDYIETDKLKVSTTKTLGFSVAIHNDKILVGDSNDNSLFYSNGKILVYGFVNDGTEPSFGGELMSMTASDAAYNDRLGSSLAVDGDRVASGAIFFDGESINNIGKVYIYEWNGTSYVEIASVLSPTPEGSSYFSNALAMSGNRLVVGAEREGDSGKVYIFEWNGTSYEPTATLTPSSTQSNQTYGCSIDLAGNGNMLAVGAENKEGGGCVYMYKWNGTSYDEVGIITAHDAYDNNHHFGKSVSFIGNTKIAVTSNDYSRSDYAARVYIYDLSDTIYEPIDPTPGDPDPNDPQPDGQFEVQQITASDAQSSDQFGSSVAVDGTRLVVGASLEGTAADGAGKVYVYEWNGASYVEVGTLTASDAQTYDIFGAAVALDGTRLVVGADGEDTAAFNAGKVYVYDWNGSSYDEVGTLTASDAQGNDNFGGAVALDGTRLVVGAEYEDTAGVNTGKVYIYDWNGTSYVQVGTLTASDAQSGDEFGKSVALDGTRLVVGAQREGTTHEYAGKVYIYEWNGTAYDEVTTLTASDAEADDSFGASVAVDGTRLVVGAYREDTAANTAGKVYIYEWNGTSYDEVMTLTASDAEEGDYFGSSVALDGARLVVGAQGEGSVEAGKVYIYDF